MKDLYQSDIYPEVENKNIQQSVQYDTHLFIIENFYEEQFILADCLIPENIFLRNNIIGAKIYF